MKLTDNTLLITGGGSGIGRGLAEALHALGNQVVIAGRTARTLDETTAANPGMQSLRLDITDPDTFPAFAGQVTQRFPRLNILINMAGVMRPEDLRSLGDPGHPGDPGDPGDLAAARSDIEAMVATNLLGPLLLTTALLPLLRRQPRATVMNVTSGLAFLPLTMTPTYCATKAALHSYTESLRYQLRDTAVEVVELIPPYVQTTLSGEHQASDPQAMPLGEYITEVMELLRADPTPPEINVQRVLALRFAAEKGQAGYDAQFRGFNDAMAAALAH